MVVAVAVAVTVTVVVLVTMVVSVIRPRLVRRVCVTGLVIVLVAARALRIREVTSLLDPVLARLRRR